MIAHEAELSCGAMERLFSERVARAECMLAAQRLYVRRLEDSGSDIAQPQALLRLMEAVTEQFRAAWRLFRTYEAPRLVQVGDGAGPASMAQPSAPSSTNPVLAEPPPALPATELATFPCPHCGLMLAVGREGDGALVYAIGEWLQQCRHQRLQTPVLCQLIPSSAEAVH